MKKIENFDFESVFGAPEGSANLYYGLIRSGKTYGATSDIIDELNMGRVVYATWPVKVKDFDDRQSMLMLFMNTILFRKVFYKIDCIRNFHYIDAERGEVDGVYTFNPKRPSEYIEYLNQLNHCSLYIDEAWRVIDSYQGTNFGVEGRNLILVTGHKFRTVNLIAQRPTSIHVTARGNMNRFYKFVKIASWPWVRFARYEFQTMDRETVDESQEPISTKTYWAKKSVFDAYNSWYYGELLPLHNSYYEAFELDFSDKVFSTYLLIKRRLKPFIEVIHRLYTKTILTKLNINTKITTKRENVSSKEKSISSLSDYILVVYNKIKKKFEKGQDTNKDKKGRRLSDMLPKNKRSQPMGRLPSELPSADDNFGL